MWLLLPFFPLLAMEALIAEMLSPFVRLFEKITAGMDFDRVFTD